MRVTISVLHRILMTKNSISYYSI